MDVRRALPLIVVTLPFLLAGLASPAIAAVEFGPFVGQSIPTGSMFVEPSGPLGFQVKSMTMYGARITWWASERFGVEASAAFGRADMLLVSSTEPLSIDSGVWHGDVRARVRLNPSDSPSGLFLTAGVGVQNFQNPFLDLATSIPGSGFSVERRIAGIAGLGTSFPLTERLTMRADIEDRIYQDPFDIDEAITGFENDDRLQHDVVVSLGLVFPVW